MTPSQALAAKKQERTMLQEWVTPFNSFNSLKGLLYRSHMEGIVAQELLPAVEASIDPIYSCNLDCVWCNSHWILKNGSKRNHRMTKEHLLNLCTFLAAWGVKGVCFAGGGEPFLHEGCADAVEILARSGVESAFLSNGTVMRKEDMEALVRYGKFIGISLDSATRENYARIKRVGPDLFDQAVENFRRLVEMKRRYDSKLEICLKFLIYPENAEYAYEACRLGKEMGADYFHGRPAAAENILGDKAYRLDFPMDIINEQMSRCFTLSDERYQVYGVRHKFTGTFNLRRDFTKCLAPPLLIQCGADGNVYLCVDHRGKKEYIIGSHFPDPAQILDFWGGQAHLEMMRTVNLDLCPRCTFSIYNEIIEKAIVDDTMCRNFP
jgi:sulfatase maturation enzyme AslB (radical SAM superfamily)